jgi:hypothetical protein
MDGKIWFFLALVLALVAVSVMQAGRRRRSWADQASRHCPHCETPMSLRRVSILESLTLRGLWLCPHCGTRLHKRRGKVQRPAMR